MEDKSTVLNAFSQLKLLKAFFFLSLLVDAWRINDISSPLAMHRL